MKTSWNRYAGRIYLSLIVADNYPEQAPEYKLARWYDLFWLLIPMIGFMIFMESIKKRSTEGKK